MEVTSIKMRLLASSYASCGSKCREEGSACNIDFNVWKWDTQQSSAHLRGTLSGAKTPTQLRKKKKKTNKSKTNVTLLWVPLSLTLLTAPPACQLLTLTLTAFQSQTGTEAYYWVYNLWPSRQRCLINFRTDVSCNQNFKDKCRRKPAPNEAVNMGS